VTPRDVDILRDRLRSIARSAQTLDRLAEDLHTLAYDRAVGGDLGPRTATPRHELNPLTGDPFARKVFGKLSARAREADDILRGFTATVGNMLGAGQRDDQLLGSLISPAELARAVKAQRRRNDRGEYVPVRTVAQPPYPKKGDKR
jgi:hypothetical protein